MTTRNFSAFLLFEVGATMLVILALFGGPTPDAPLASLGGLRIAAISTLACLAALAVKE